jgi:UDPglucose 6-dehydrogenase
MKSIGIIGQGFVGTAVREGMRHAFEVLAYDKKDPEVVYSWHNNEAEMRVLGFKSDNPLDYLLNRSDGGPIFICLPTPMYKDGRCDTSIVETVVKAVDKAAIKRNISPVVTIKSTVPPGTTEKLNNEVKNIIVCFNPEFLTERNAVQDFKNQNRIILGGPHEGTAVLKQMYQIAYPNIPTTKTSSTIAEMVKYVTNCFLATKVSFANEIKQICDGLDIDYDKVVEYSTKDERLGNSHWAVPGPDGHYGFGLTCFPKDLNALICLARGLQVDPKMMIAAWQKNLEVRPERDWEAMLGRAVVEEQNG